MFPFNSVNVIPRKFPVTCVTPITLLRTKSYRISKELTKGASSGKFAMQQELALRKIFRHSSLKAKRIHKLFSKLPSFLSLVKMELFFELVV